MNECKVRDLFPKLNRPEYPTSPEIFLTSIAWGLFDVEGVSADVRRKFRRQQRHSDQNASGEQRGGKVEYSWERLVEPSSGFASNLRDAGFALSRGSVGEQLLISSDFVKALLSGVTGTTSIKSDSIAVSPLSPSLALLQTVKGMKGTNANFALMFEQIWQLGLVDSEDSIGESWLRASERMLDRNMHLKALDRALDSTKGFGPRVRKNSRSSQSEPWAIGQAYPELMIQSPMGWFTRSWKNLTSEQWIDALPPRVWTDWASAVLRTAFGMTYLWEAAWYHTVAENILSRESQQFNFSSMRGALLLPWAPSDLPISLRGVKGYIDKKVRTGSEISSLLSTTVKEMGLADVSLEVGLEALRRNANFLKSLAAAKNLPTTRHTSTVEAVTYSLNIRKEFGEGADHFGLLSLKGGRFRVPDPGTEWLAAVVSLSSRAPRESINMGNLLFELNSMGLNPPTSELVSELERAGLARGSADADIGLNIDTAF
ncbi:hypothetical protein AKACHI_12850 [Aquiluna sp. KACHI24]|nr:hypothetical protein AKACHI_12850 [Aquiluna sp. KACHI24]